MKALANSACLGNIVLLGLHGWEQLRVAPKRGPVLYTSILHISDLHRDSESERDQRVILNAFVEDIRTQRENGGQFDLLLFTGDIVRKAECADDYVIAAEDMSEISTAGDITEALMVFCPGNHDANQAYVKEHIEALVGFREEARQRDGLNRLAERSAFQDHINRAFDNYKSFVNLHDTSLRVDATPFGEVRLFPGRSLGVVSINTAILSSAGLKGYSDRHALAFPEHSLREFIARVPADFGRLVVGHHPLDWLNDESRATVEQILSETGAHYFHGHMHDVNPKYIRTLAGSSSFFQSSALYCGRENNGYAICLMDPKFQHTWLRIRSYYHRRNRFDVGTDRAPQGEFFSSNEARTVFGREEAHLTLLEWQKTTLRDFVVQYTRDSLSLENLSDVFVDPEFERDAPIRKDAPIPLGGETVRLDFAELLNSDANHIIAAPPESGRTSLLLEWAVRETLRVEGAQRPGRIPVYIQFNELPSYAARFVPFIRGRLPQLPSEVRLDDLLEQGKFLVLIDDVDLLDVHRVARLKLFLARFPKCRFIVATGTSLLSSPGVQPMIGDTVTFESVRLRPLRIGQLRTLAERLGVRDRAENEKLISRLYDEMQELSVPITPVTSTFLLRIYKDDDTVTFVNRATLIERFVELLLDRYAFQELVPGSFDFKNKTHLLGFISEKMVMLENYAPSCEVVRSWISEYLLDLGLPYSPDKTLEYFLTSRILKTQDNVVTYKLRAFFSFFCALRMAASKEFKSYILAAERYLKFAEEIGFYSAVQRDDEETLSLLKDRFEGAQEHGLFDGSVKADVGQIRNFQLPQEKEPDAFLRAIEQQIFGGPLAPSERDAILYSENSSLTPSSQTVLSTLPDDDERPIAQLSLLSSVLRHMDLVPDQLKRETLKELLDGWNQLLAKSLTVVPGLMSKQRMTLDGVDYRLNLPKDTDAEEMTRNILIAMPIAIGRMAFYRLGSEKLAPQLAEGIGDAATSVEAQVLRFNILADVGVRNLNRYVEILEKQLRPYSYLVNVLLMKVNETLLRLQYDEKEAASLRNSAADILISRGGSISRAGKGKLVNRLKSRELTLRLHVDQKNKRDES